MHVYIHRSQAQLTIVLFHTVDFHNSPENILVSADGTNVTFFFGDMIRILGDMVNETCVDVVVVSIIRDIPELAAGAIISLSGVVVTDFSIATDPEIISFEVTMAYQFT